MNDDFFPLYLSYLIHLTIGTIPTVLAIILAFFMEKKTSYSAHTSPELSAGCANFGLRKNRPVFLLFSAEVEVVALGIFPYCMASPQPYPYPIHLHCLCLRNCIKCAHKKGWRRGDGERGGWWGWLSQKVHYALISMIVCTGSSVHMFSHHPCGSQSKFSYLIYSKNWLHAAL